MEEKKVYTRKDFSKLLEELKETTIQIELYTQAFELLIAITPELGEGKKSKDLEEVDGVVETFLQARENFFKNIEEYEKILAELKEAVLHISSAYTEDKEEK